MCLQILEKILKINVCEGTIYTQGYNNIVAMVINKFLRYSDHDYTIEDEAKIYYVYKTILKTVVYGICYEINEKTEAPFCAKRSKSRAKKAGIRAFFRC